MMLRGLFARRAGAPPLSDRGETGRIKSLVTGLLAAPVDSEVTVSEIVCFDPACPGTETVILVMPRGGKTRAAKIAKPAGDATEPDVRAALVEAGFEVRT